MIVRFLILILVIALSAIAVNAIPTINCYESSSASCTSGYFALLYLSDDDTFSRHASINGAAQWKPICCQSYYPSYQLTLSRDLSASQSYVINLQQEHDSHVKALEPNQYYSYSVGLLGSPFSVECRAINGDQNCDSPETQTITLSSDTDAHVSFNDFHYTFNKKICCRFKCASAETSCSNGVDDDCDTKTDCADTDCAGQYGPQGVTCCQDTGDCSGFSEGNCGSISCDSSICDVTLTPSKCSTTVGVCGSFTGSCNEESDGSYSCIYYGNDDLCDCNSYCGTSFDCNALPSSDCAYNWETCTNYVNDGDPLTLPGQISECSCHGLYTSCSNIETGSTDAGDAVC